MFAQRSTQQALRRFAATRPSMIAQISAKGLTTPLAIAASSQFRQVTTQKITPADAYDILVQQRKLRPNSPHLTIYRPQLTWYLSALNRITGSILSGAFYVFGAAYLVAPVFGWHVESASIAAAFGSLPYGVKVATKLFFALPFTFHSFNGLRHLAWDTGRSFQNSTVIKTGWTVVAVSVASALYLAVGL